MSNKKDLEIFIIRQYITNNLLYIFFSEEKAQAKLNKMNNTSTYIKYYITPWIVSDNYEE